MDAAKKALSGHGRPVNAGPSERRWSEGTRRNAPGWIEGQVFLVPFGTIAKRNSPGRAKPSPVRQLGKQPGATATGEKKKPITEPKAFTSVL